MRPTMYYFYLTPFWGLSVLLSPGPSVAHLRGGTLPTWKCSQGSIAFEVTTGFKLLIFMVCIKFLHSPVKLCKLLSTAW